MLDQCVEETMTAIALATGPSGGPGSALAWERRGEGWIVVRVECDCEQLQTAFFQVHLPGCLLHHLPCVRQGIHSQFQATQHPGDFRNPRLGLQQYDLRVGGGAVALFFRLELLVRLRRHLG